jgi:hypothetical protein
MPRRASSKIHPAYIAVAIVVLILAVLGGMSLVGKKKAAFGDLQPIDVRQLMENANSMRGSEYLVEGEVNEKLHWTPDRGQFISLRVKDGRDEEVIGIEIPPDFNNVNIEVRQSYAIRVRVRDGGILVATGINRL